MLLDVADKRGFSRYGTIFGLNRIGYNVGLFLGKNIILLQSFPEDTQLPKIAEWNIGAKELSAEYDVGHAKHAIMVSIFIVGSFVSGVLMKYTTFAETYMATGISISVVSALLLLIIGKVPDKRSEYSDIERPYSDEE